MPIQLVRPLWQQEKLMSVLAQSDKPKEFAPDNVVERSDLMIQGLLDMDLIVKAERQKCSSGSAAYGIAESQSPAYVQDMEFRLMFLRSVRFNATLATELFFRFLEHKLELFGNAKLCSKIKLEDLDKEDAKFLKTGSHQVLPVRDIAGRLIIVHFLALAKYKTVENAVRKTRNAQKWNRFHLHHICSLRLRVCHL